MCGDYWVQASFKNHLKPPLEKWITIIKNYSNRGNNDHLYWYNERATLSTFASSLAKCGHIFLEEFRETKGERKGEWNGRVDLWFEIKRTDYYAEAKQTWVSLSNRANSPIDKARLGLENAISDARASVAQAPEAKPLGINFVVPYLSALGAEKDGLPGKIETLKRNIKELDNIIAYAYFFPREDVNITSNNYLYPGVILLMAN